MVGFLRFGLGRGSERWAGYADRDTPVLEAIEEGVHQWLALEQIVPLGVVEVGGDDGRFSAVPLVHQLEESIDLLRIEREVPQFVDEQEIVGRKPLEELGRASVGKGSVEFV